MDFATSYKSSTNARKQRLYIYNAPAHIKGKMLGAHLSKELRTKLKRRSLRIRIGDRVTVMRGQYKKKTGKVERVDVTGLKVFVTGIERTRKDGSKAQYPFKPSNLIINEIAIGDKRRTKERKAPVKKAKKSAAKAEESK